MVLKKTFVFQTFIELKDLLPAVVECAALHPRPARRRLPQQPPADGGGDQAGEDEEETGGPADPLHERAALPGRHHHRGPANHASES